MDMREKMIEQRLTNGAESICIKCFHRNVCRAIDNQPCIECNQFADANGVTIATDNNVGHKWIPVTERLPDLELVEAKSNDFDIYPCLATVKNNRANNGRYVGKVWWDGEIFLNADCTDVTHDVTHWMPLPEPAKGE